MTTSPRLPPVPAPDPAKPWLRLMPGVFVVLWSTGFIGARYGLPYAGPLTFLLIRFAIVAAILLAAAIISGAPWPRSPAAAARIAVSGLLIQGVYLGGVFIAIKLGMPAAVAALIVGLQPLLTGLGAGRFLGERLSARQWLGLALGFAGVALVVSAKLGLAGVTVWSLVAAVAALAGITVGTLYQKRHGGGMNLLTGGVIQFAASGLVYLPAAVVFEGLAVTWTADFVLALMWLSLVLSLGAISLLFLMIRHGEVSRVASLFYLTPAVTAVFAWLLFGERLAPAAVAGMAVAAAGVYLATRGRR